MPPPRSQNPIADYGRREHLVRALLEARRDLLENSGVRPSAEQAPLLYAMRLIEADDDYGTRNGLIVQSDELTWRRVDALLDFAILGQHAHKAVFYPSLRVNPRCEWSARAETVTHTGLLGLLCLRRDISPSEVTGRSPTPSVQRWRRDVRRTAWLSRRRRVSKTSIPEGRQAAQTGAR